MTRAASFIATVPAMLLVQLAASGAAPAAEPPVPGQFCSNTARAADTACRFDAQEEYWLALAGCRNSLSGSAATRCERAAATALSEARGECGDQRTARLEVCGDLGEAPYAPQIRPADFVSRITNPYFPLEPGTINIYRNRGGEEEERIVVAVTDETRTILGVSCTAVHDVATVEGVVVEDTVDWYAQDRHGNVWYFGELAQNFEDGRLVDLDGSWLAGVDGAQPGIVMRARPQVGDVYRQEFFLADAEDVGEVISLGGRATVPAASCSNCLITRDFTPLEPDVEERKFYARGIGSILEVNTETGERLELVEIRHR